MTGGFVWAWVFLLWTVTIIRCDNNKTVIDYYEELITNGIEESQTYTPLTSSKSYKPDNEGSPIGM